MSSSSAVAQLDPLVAGIEELITSDRTDAVSAEDLQRLISAAVRLYAVKVEAEGPFPAVPYGAINATQAMLGASALLKGANVNVFELGLWQSWSS